MSERKKSGPQKVVRLGTMLGVGPANVKTPEKRGDEPSLCCTNCNFDLTKVVADSMEQVLYCTQCGAPIQVADDPAQRGLRKGRISAVSLADGSSSADAASSPLPSMIVEGEPEYAMMPVPPPVPSATVSDPAPPEPGPSVVLPEYYRDLPDGEIVVEFPEAPKRHATFVGGIEPPAAVAERYQTTFGQQLKGKPGDTRGKVLERRCWMGIKIFLLLLLCVVVGRVLFGHHGYWPDIKHRVLERWHQSMQSQPAQRQP